MNANDINSRVQLEQINYNYIVSDTLSRANSFTYMTDICEFKYIF